MDHCPWLDPQNRDEANNPAPRLHQAKGVTYDTESGQVYMEKTVRAPRKKRTNWINEYKTPGLIKRGHTNGEGAASLFNMAKAKVARQMQHLTRSHLEGIPPLIGKKLWDEVEKRYEMLFGGHLLSKLITFQPPGDFSHLAHSCFCLSRYLDVTISALLYGHQRACGSPCRIFRRLGFKICEVAFMLADRTKQHR